MNGPDPRASDRRREVALAGHTGNVALAREALDDPDPKVRAAATGALARLGALEIDDLDSALMDPSASVRARAAEIAAAFSDAGALLVTTLEDKDPLVVEAACFALGEIGPSVGGVAVSALAVVCQTHPDPLCREAAVAALGSISDEDGLPAILAATLDKPAVRRRAVLALAPFSGPDVDAALEAALTDRDWQVRQAAEDLVDRPATS